jgi:multiple sugar transport system permease protein
MVFPLLLIGLLFRLMDAYKLFDLAWVLTGGGPGESTKLLPVHLYKVAFSEFNTGEASAIGYIMLVVIIALANLLIRALNAMKDVPEA